MDEVHLPGGGGEDALGVHERGGEWIPHRATAEVVERGAAVGDLRQHAPLPGVDVVGESIAKAGSIGESADDVEIALHPRRGWHDRT